VSAAPTAAAGAAPGVPAAEAVELPALWHDATTRPPASDADAVRAATAWLHHEARLLDAGEHAAWFAAWEPDGLMWFPLDPTADAVHRQSWGLDDHRRLGERLARLADPAAWSQRPASRTVRQVAGVEAWAGDDGLLVASTLVVWERRGGERRAWPARQVHVLRPRASGHGVVRKVIALLDAIDGIPNHSFLL
jgi:3-phenylpropionate/cinnamic acid dioxygenase small subunit